MLLLRHYLDDCQLSLKRDYMRMTLTAISRQTSNYFKVFQCYFVSLLLLYYYTVTLVTYNVVNIFVSRVLFFSFLCSFIVADKQSSFVMCDTELARSKTYVPLSLCYCFMMREEINCVVRIVTLKKVSIKFLWCN